MFIRAKHDFELPAYNIRKGALVDLPEADAKAAITRGDAIPVSKELAIREIVGERATTNPAKATDNPKPKRADREKAARENNTPDGAPALA